MTPSWDLFVIIFFIISVVFGIALGRERAIVGVIASYIGLVVSNVWGNAVYNLIGGNTAASLGTISINASTSPFVVKAVIFVVIVLLLIAKGDFLKKAITHHVGLFSMLAAGIYSFLNAGIIITALVSFLSDAQRTDLLTQSNLANMVIQYQTWWLVLPVVLMVLLGFKHVEEEK